MNQSNSKVSGVIVKFERTVFLNSEDYDLENLENLDRTNIEEMALELWNEYMELGEILMSEDDISSIEVEVVDDRGKVVLHDLDDLEG